MVGAGDPRTCGVGRSGARPAPDLRGAGCVGRVVAGAAGRARGGSGRPGGDAGRQPRGTGGAAVRVRPATGGARAAQLAPGPAGTGAHRRERARDGGGGGVAIPRARRVGAGGSGVARAGSRWRTGRCAASTRLPTGATTAAWAPCRSSLGRASRWRRRGAHPVHLRIDRGAQGGGPAASPAVLQRGCHHDGVGTGRQDIAPVSTPFFHTGGWNVFATPLWQRGGRVVLFDQFDPAGLSRRDSRPERCTVALTIPTQLVMLLESSAWGTRPVACAASSRAARRARCR